LLLLSVLPMRLGSGRDLDILTGENIDDAGGGIVMCDSFVAFDDVDTEFLDIS
jgi:hypothetical protein